MRLKLRRGSALLSCKYFPHLFYFAIRNSHLRLRLFSIWKGYSKGQEQDLLYSQFQKRVKYSGYLKRINHFFEPFTALNYIFIAVCEGHAKVSFTARTKYISGNQCDLGLLQQIICKSGRFYPKFLTIDKDIERSLGTPAGQSRNFIDRLYGIITPVLIFLHHSLNFVSFITQQL